MTTRAGVLMGSKTPLEYVRQSVQSILHQTHEDFKFLIIDDEGPRETWEYLQTLHDPRLRIIRHEKCQGIAATLNEGLQLLDTEFVFNIDADDVANPHRLEWQMEFFDRNPQVAVLGGVMQAMDEHGRRLSRKYKVPARSDEIAYQLLWSSAINHPTVAYRREVILQAGGYNSDFKTSMDYNLWTRLSPQVPMANLSRTLMNYRVHAAQSHKTFDTHKTEAWQSRLAYRSKLTGLSTHDCDETAVTKNWSAREKFYRELAQKFPAGKFRRDLARRLLREVKGDQEAHAMAKQTIFHIHPLSAVLAQLRGHL